MKFGQAYLLLSALLIAVPAVAGAANGGCVIKLGESVAGKRSADVLALDASSRQAPYRLSFGCQDGVVASVQLRSIPGQAVEAQFLLVRRESAVAEIEWDENTLSAWSQFALEPSGEGAVVTLRIEVPDSATPGSVHSARLQFRSRQAGQADSFTLHIPSLSKSSKPVRCSVMISTPRPIRSSASSAWSGTDTLPCRRAIASATPVFNQTIQLPPLSARRQAFGLKW